MGTRRTGNLLHGIETAILWAIVVAADSDTTPPSLWMDADSVRFHLFVTTPSTWKLRESQV